jgi:hypothetical protein
MACLSEDPPKIPNYKHQITNKSQFTILNDPNDMFGILNFGDCYLFDIWDLLFGISSERAA